MVSGLVLVVVVLAFYGLFYRHVVGRLGTFAERLLADTAIAARHSQRDVNDGLKLVAAGISQFLFAVSLWLLAGVPVSALTAGLAPGVLSLALVLGVAELGMASMLGRAASMITTRSDEALSRALSEAQGGWMRQFRALVRVGRFDGALPVVVLYVTGEEIVFRVVALHLLAGAGQAWAVTISTALFVTVQLFGMAGLRAAMFPMLGAVTIGLTHAWLYLQIPAVAPLVLAHTVFLLGALTPSRVSRLGTRR
jgi:hypothetical protein